MDLEDFVVPLTVKRSDPFKPPKASQKKKKKKSPDSDSENDFPTITKEEKANFYQTSKGTSNILIDSLNYIYIKSSESNGMQYFKCRDGKNQDEDVPTTSNGVESYHSGLRKAIPQCNTIWTLIDGLKDVEVKVHLKRLEHLQRRTSGPQVDIHGLPTGSISGRQEKAAMKAHELKCVLSRFDEVDHILFLQLVSGHINLDT